MLDNRLIIGLGILCLFVTGCSDELYIVQSNSVNASGGSGNVTIHNATASFTTNGLNFTGSAVSSITNTGNVANIVLVAGNASGGSSDGTGGWVNDSSQTSTYKVVNVGANDSNDDIFGSTQGVLNVNGTIVLGLSKFHGVGANANVTNSNNISFVYKTNTGQINTLQWYFAPSGTSETMILRSSRNGGVLLLNTNANSGYMVLYHYLMLLRACILLLLLMLIILFLSFMWRFLIVLRRTFPYF